MRHVELLQVWAETHLCEVQTCAVSRDDRLLFHRHVIPKSLGIELLALRSSLNDKLRAEDIGEFGPETVPSTCNFLLLIVVVARR